MDRRSFLKNAATTGGALAAAGLLRNQSKAQGGPPPNILFILVDELRYPSVFPQGISDAGSFLSQFMPNTYELVWQKGVKFAGHYTASSACTPARGTLVTGLYAQQSWLLQTIFSSPTSTISFQPVLSPSYPTYGKLLRQAGYRYQTPYIGKWHLSIPLQNQRGLEDYGFDYRLYPDPTGSNLQGTIGDADPVYGDTVNVGYLNDADIATQAANWLQQRQPSDQPWCLTVGFINPHDKEFFPAGTEFQTFTDLFQSSANPNNFQQFINYTSPASGSPKYDWITNPLKDPPSLAYPAVPPNWESADQIAKTKPSTQTFVRFFSEVVWGGVNDDPSATDFSIVEYRTNRAYPPVTPPYGIAKAPYRYWRRSLDSYTQIMQILDVQIGNVINALPSAVANNTIVVLTSDHGDYAGAHGFVSNKVGSCYEEAYNVPLMVVDPTGRFTGDIDTIRTGLTSSVDILPLLVSLGYNGSRNWLTGDLRRIYGGRHDLLPMLKSASAAGRPYVVFTTDETAPGVYNFNNSPLHITGVRTPDGKLGVYANWQSGTTNIAFDSTLETEYYDYATPDGRAELDNTNHQQAARQLFQQLVNDILPNELRAPLPASYVPAQTLAKAQYLAYVRVINALPIGELPLSIGDV